MLIANLARYDIGGDSCDCGQSCSLGMEPAKEGDYVKFEEAVEASSNSLRQLKAEIALLCIELEESICFRGRSVNEIIVSMRQLSAI